MKKRCIIAGMISVCAFLAFGATHLEVDFDSLATGEIDNGGPTTAQLNSATTGGSWSLTSDANLTHEIQDDGGDKAFKSNYANVNSGWTTFFSINLDTAIDIDAMTSDLSISFDTAVDAGTSFHREVQWQFVDSDGSTVLFTIWADDNGKIRFDGQDLGSTGDWAGNDVLTTWDKDSIKIGHVSIVVDSAGNVTFDMTVDTDDFSDTSSFTASGAELAEIRVRADPDQYYGQGAWMNDVLIESGEPPGSVFR
ncbi:hypothetical protein BVX94_02465, partial [bacterium B17]